MDLGPAVVEATLEQTAAGVRATGWTGPPALVDAVAATLGGCTGLGAEPAPFTWVFPEPPISVSGVVRAEGTGRPVQLALLVGDRVVHTDTGGGFVVRNLTLGPAAVAVAGTQWRVDPPVVLDVAPGTTLELELWVEPDRLGDDEIVAVYDGTPSRARSVATQRAAAVPATLGDPLRALTTEPGLTRTPYDAGWLLVRGGDFDDVGLYLDGVPVPLVYHLGGFTSVLHPQLIEQIRFWPGLFPARYGDAISGAVDLVPRPIGEVPRVDAGANLVFAHAFAEAPVRGGGVAVAARRSWLDGVLGLALGPDAAGIAPRFWDASTVVEAGPVRVLGLLAGDGIDAPSYPSGLVVHIEQRSAQVQAKLALARGLTLSPWIAHTVRTLSDADPTGDVQRVAERDLGLRAEGRASVSDGATLGGGFEVRHHAFDLALNDVAVAVPVVTVDPYVDAAIDGPVQLWSEARATVAAVDAEDWPVLHGVSPRAGMRWPAAPGVEVRGELGHLEQLPTTTLWLPIPDGAYLPLERSDQGSVGATLRRGGVTVSADAWIRRSDDLAEIELDGSIGGSNGRAAGVETAARLTRDGFTLSTVLQYTTSDRREDLDQRWLPSPFELPWQLDVVWIQQLPHAQTVSARARATSGFPRLREAGVWTPISAFDLLTQQTVQLDLAAADPRLPPLWTVDARYARQWTTRRWTWTTSLELKNATNQRVVEPVITGFGESPRPGYGFGLPILPIFGVDGAWVPVRRSAEQSPQRGTADR
ncbi:MAG: TonB-dependent receptor [Myxococcota bacterium]